NPQSNAYEPFTTGAEATVFGGFTFGPDGNLYVSNSAFNGPASIQRYDGTTGAYLGDLVSQPGLQPSRPAFGPDGSLYVGDSSDNTVKRYDFAGGTFTIFASGGGLSGPAYLAFGPDGNLYVASAGTDSVLRYNGTSGEFIDVFATGGGMKMPIYLTFSP